MAGVPNRGDIVHLDFGPSSGQDMKGTHFGFVVSGKVFNQQGLAMICPVSQGGATVARTYGTLVMLMGAGTDTQGYGSRPCRCYKHIDTNPRLIAVDLQQQLLRGSIEHALHHLRDQHIDLSGLAAKYKHDATGASAYPPAMRLKVILFAEIVRRELPHQSDSPSVGVKQESVATLLNLHALRLNWPGRDHA